MFFYGVVILGMAICLFFAFIDILKIFRNQHKAHILDQVRLRNDVLETRSLLENLEKINFVYMSIIITSPSNVLLDEICEIWTKIEMLYEKTDEYVLKRREIREANWLINEVREIFRLERARIAQFRANRELERLENREFVNWKREGF